MHCKFRNKIAKFNELCGYLPDIEDPQVELRLLRSCIGFPKINYTLRCCEAEKIKDVLQDFPCVLLLDVRIFLKQIGYKAHYQHRRVDLDFAMRLPRLRHRICGGGRRFILVCAVLWGVKKPSLK
jgi:hypothetical protein